MTTLVTQDGVRWSAHHDGYGRLGVVHHRVVVLDREARTLEIEDWLEAASAHRVALAFHLGPLVAAALEGSSVALHWPGHIGRIELAGTLAWRGHRGESDPPLGWYSPGFGRRVPAWSLVGRGVLAPATRLRTVLHFPPASEASTTCEMVHAAF